MTARNTIKFTAVSYREATRKRSKGLLWVDCKKLTSLRLSRELLIRELAGLSGISITSVTDFGSGTRIWASKSIVNKLAKALKVHPDSLVIDTCVWTLPDPASGSARTELSRERFKQCSLCECTKLADNDHFYWGKQRGSWDNVCRVCRNAETRRYRILYQEKDGWTESNNQKQRERYAADPSKYNEQNNRWRHNNPEYCESQKLKIKEWRARKYATDAEWTKLEKARRKVHGHKRRALECDAGDGYTAEGILQMYEDQEGLCAYCGVRLNGDYHADHMQPLSRGGAHCAENIALTCPQCNLSKNDKTAEEFWVYMQMKTKVGSPSRS